LKVERFKICNYKCSIINLPLPAGRRSMLNIQIFQLYAF
jgi:hypothetical protein